MATALEDARTDLVGDGYDPEPLMTATEVAKVLKLAPKAVYDLPIKRVRLGPRRLRWRPEDVRAFIAKRTEA
jgi:predicted DNA-binding transcriptional regulator AlpA